MRVLITSARLPHALGQIRKFGLAGHDVFATDTFRTSPGLHSKQVKEAILTASPAFETRRFIDDLREILESRSIDLLVPAFEELFYIAKHLPELSEAARVFLSPLELLARLHDKRQFAELPHSLGLPIADTRVVTSSEEMRAAAEEFGEYFGRAAFSRGGVALLTNTGPLAGAVALEDCQPTPEQPWLIQRFVHGEDLCSMSVAHHGKIAAHCTYRHPLTIEHAGGIVFESIDCPEAFEIARRYVEATGFHGQISFDYLQTDDGLYVVECNPRPTAGVFLMTAEELSKAVFDPDLESPLVVPAGRREQIDSAIVRDMFREPRDIPSDMKLLLSGTEDVYSQKGDRLPGIYQILAYSHVFAFRHRMHVKKHKHSDLMEAQFFDIAWDGGEIE